MQYIINKAEPFRGFAQSVLYLSEEFGREVVAYSDGKSWKQYKLEKEKEGLKLELVTQEEFDRMNSEYLEGRKSKLSEITRERYWEMLEILPPERFGTYSGCQGFHVSEHITGDLVSWFFNVGERYFECVQSDNITSEQIAGLLSEIKS